MKRALYEDSIWFLHKDWRRFYPWRRYSRHHGICSLFVSEGSNLIEDAIPVATVQAAMTPSRRGVRKIQWRGWRKVWALQRPPEGFERDVPSIR